MVVCRLAVHEPHVIDELVCGEALCARQVRHDLIELRAHVLLHGLQPVDELGCGAVHRIAVDPVVFGRGREILRLRGVLQAAVLVDPADRPRVALRRLLKHHLEPVVPVVGQNSHIQLHPVERLVSPRRGARLVDAQEVLAHRQVVPVLLPGVRVLDGDVLEATPGVVPRHDRAQRLLHRHVRVRRFLPPVPEIVQDQIEGVVPLLAAAVEGLWAVQQGQH
mmetsp:Transcript_28724/g.81160  ORF Transcript_28724/g.81160 Transcript_28724/m.81160 type:complete len:221 (+) Transcript_28724:155-817(+)